MLQERPAIPGSMLLGSLGVMVTATMCGPLYAMSIALCVKMRGVPPLWLVLLLPRRLSRPFALLELDAPLPFVLPAATLLLLVSSAPLSPSVSLSNTLSDSFSAVNASLCASDISPTKPHAGRSSRKSSNHQWLAAACVKAAAPSLSSFVLQMRVGGVSRRKRMGS